MPKCHRQGIKRALDQAIAQIEKAQTYVIREGAQYEGVHPDLYNRFANIVTALDLTADAIRALQDHI